MHIKQTLLGVCFIKFSHMIKYWPSHSKTIKKENQWMA